MRISGELDDGIRQGEKRMLWFEDATEGFAMIIHALLRLVSLNTQLQRFGPTLRRVLIREELDILSDWVGRKNKVLISATGASALKRILWIHHELRSVSLTESRMKGLS